jgi:tRNA 2-thiouridine synthesizing protein D
MSLSLLILLSNSSDEANLALSLAGAFKGRGVDTTIFLIEDGVFVARKGQKRTGGTGVLEVESLIDKGVNVLAEDLSLKARGLSPEKIVEAVKVSTLDELVDLLMEKSDRAVWF